MFCYRNSLRGTPLCITQNFPGTVREEHKLRSFENKVGIISRMKTAMENIINTTRSFKICFELLTLLRNTTEKKLEWGM
jgi:hypothetical protein